MKNSETLMQSIQAMPKAELHIHLEGSVRLPTLLELSRRHPQHNHLPGKDLSSIEDWWQSCRNFADFARMFDAVQKLMRTPDDFALAVYELGRNMAEENIRYAEVMVAPYTHTHIQNKGMTVDDILQGLDEGRHRVYQDFEVELCWVFGFARGFCVNPDGSYNLRPAEMTLAYAVEGRAHNVIGLTVGGFELSCPPEVFEDIFKTGKQEGLLSLPHSGETVGPYSEYVRTAVEKLEADRIGHGIRAVDDPDLLSLLRERQIPLDVSLTSNQVTRLYQDLHQHPFKQLDQTGLLLTVNTDDPALFNTTLSNEYALLGDVFGYTLRDVKRLARNAFVASGAEAALKNRLLAKFDRASQSPVHIDQPNPET